MIWSSLSDFLAMGGHGAYVWAAYVAMAALFVIESVSLRRRGMAARRRAAHKIRQPGHGAPSGR